jgi:hypothetical protein
VKSTTVAVFGALAGLVMGCGPKAAKLAPAKVTALRLTPAIQGSVLCVNGRSLQLMVTAYYREGAPQQTWVEGGRRGGKLSFKTFEWGSSLGSIDDRGRVVLPADPFAVVDRKVQVTVRIPQRPDMNATLTLEPRFDCGGQALLGGRSGYRGRAGNSGASGRPGSSGDNPSSGDRGRPGGHGGDGADGAHGPRVTVSVAYVETSRHGRLILIKSGRRLWLTRPGGRIFTIRATGGSGGDGGNGGRGGRGGDGGRDTSDDGNTGGDGGDGGDGGNGGDGGDGGDGGVVTVQYDPRFPEIMKALRFDTRGGRGGRGGGFGEGGRGGAAGSSSKGNEGRQGQMGRDGRSGQEGRRGRDGTIRVRVAAVKQLFADEIAKGIAIVTEPPAKTGRPSPDPGAKAPAPAPDR